MQTEVTSVGAALDAIGFGRVQWLLLLYTGLAWLADACETMLLSFLGPSVRCYWHVSPAAESALTSVVFAGMLLGVSSLGVLADHLGRRRGFLASALLLGAAGLASALAPSLMWLLLLRCVVGFALGGAPIAVTLFAEFCPSGERGKWSLLMQSFWTLGNLLEAALAWAVLPTLGWRWLLAFSALPLFLLLALYPLLPESAHWLVAKGRYADAEAVLQRVAAANGYPRPLLLRLAPDDGRGPAAGPAAAAANLQTSSSGLGMAGSSSGSMRDRSPAPAAVAKLPSKASPGPHAPLLVAAGQAVADHQQQQQHHRQGRKTINATVGLQQRAVSQRRRFKDAARNVRAGLEVVFGLQLRRTTLLLYCIWGVTAMCYYGLVLLSTALQTAAKKEECTPSGAPNLDSSDFFAIFVTTLAEAPGLLLAALLIDVKGRKWTLWAGLLLSGAALGSLVLDPPRAAQLAMLFVARASIEGTFSVLYVYSPELYPTAVRSLGLALCNAFSRLGGFMAPYATVALVAGGHTHACVTLLGGLCGGAALCAFLLPYETRGRDLQSTELQADGGGGGSPGLGGMRQRHASTDGGGGSDDGDGSRGRLQHVRVQHTDEEVELEPPHEHEHKGEEGRLPPARSR